MSTRHRRILVIDDDLNLLNFYEEILSPDVETGFPMDSVDSKTNNSRSFEVTAVSHGQAGYELVKQSMESKTPFAVAFIDMHMLPGWDGLKTAKAIREIDDRIFIVIITGYPDSSIDQIQDVLEHDVFYLSKPSSREEIYQMARNLCNRWDRDFGLKDTTISRDFINIPTAIEDTSTKVVRISGITDNAKILLNHKEHIIKKFPFKIGRKTSHGYDKIFDENHMFIEDEIPYNVSKNHLSINYYRNHFYILDCGSSLGTIVNGNSIGEKKSNYKSVLNKGENIVIIGSEKSPYQFKITL